MALERVKGLIDSKFNQADTELLFRASADLGEVKGEEKAKGLLLQLEKTSAKGKVNEESLNALAEAGVKAATVLEQLRQKGESLDAVRARVKSGQVAVQDFARAVGTAVEKDLGGVAGRGLDAQLGRLKLGVHDLFTDFDLGPLEGALDNVIELLSGDAGAGLKEGITEVAGAVIGLLKPLNGKEGKAALKGFFSDAAAGARELAGAIDKAGEAAHTLVEAYRAIKSGSRIALDRAVDGEAVDEPTGKAGAKGATTRKKGGDEVITVGGENSAEDDARVEASKTGSAIAAGMAAGVKAGAPKVDAAVADMAGGAIAAGNKKLDIHSPSKAFEKMGRYSDEGYAKGANDNAGLAEDAAADMAAGAAAGAKQPRSGASGPRSAGGSVSVENHYHFAPAIALAPDSSREAVTAVEEALAKAYPAFLAMIRQAQRDGREAA